jgi:hypothetical protein
VLIVLIPVPELTAAGDDEPLPELGLLLEAVLPQAESMTAAAARPLAAHHRFLI